MYWRQKLGGVARLGERENKWIWGLIFSFSYSNLKLGLLTFGLYRKEGWLVNVAYVGEVVRIRVIPLYIYREGIKLVWEVVADGLCL
jgi:hypothetical protein